ncbi:MAG: methylated-DNA--[protein]-cysteine S-methyltransferase [Carboxylicivirga sp.]|jgi:methylated-DNA-[protein]-cysteine S-methyltransferase|nr:methylated-DNA--[protein]-cysteine S-methyltransferase [Carboxylicivirga sp.]
MSSISIQYYRSSFGELIIGSFKQQLCLCDWRYRKMRNSIDQRICQGLNANYQERSTPVITQTIEQIESYTSGELKLFDLPILMVGTPFQKQVWQQLMNIPFGKTRSYLELSKDLGNAKAIRAVASANGANAISIIIPCHRIIGSNGKLVGYAGGLTAKRKLLELEGYKNKSKQLKLFQD